MVGVRRLRRSLLILTLAVAVPTAACQLSPATATSPLSADTSLSSTAGCPPNDSSPALGSGSRCIAEMMRSTRGYLNAACFNSSALTPNHLYRIGECKGRTTIQAEAIGQLRAIMRLNSQSVFGDSAPLGQITPNLQWEVPYSKPANAATGGRVDILMYDRATPGAPIQIIESKADQAGTGSVDADAQLRRYQSDFPGGPTNRPVTRYNLSGYSDRFRILVRECSTKNTEEMIYNYTAGPSGHLGVLLISDPTITTRKCQEDPPPSASATATATAPTQEPTSTPTDPPVVVPPIYRGPGGDDDGNGKDDFWEDFIKDHPELDDLPIPDAPEVPVISPDVVVPVAVAAAIVILAGACIIGGCLAALGVGLAAEAGAATIGPLITITMAALAALIGWNIFGDPHLATPDGFAYDLQSVGEFHLLEVPEEGIDIQARFTPSGPNLSLFNTVAFEINDTWVELGNGTLKINGTPVSLSGGASYNLGDGAAVMRTGRFYSVLWPGYGDRLTMMWSGSNVGFHVPKTMRTRGLLGNSNGSPTDDLALRDGTTLAANSSDSVLHGRYADSWRITDDDSRFSYGAGQTTASFTDRAFPARVITIGDFTEAEIAAATETCQQAGVVPGPQFEDCVFDVVATGDDTYAQAAAEVTQVLTDPAAHVFDDTGNLAEDFEGAVGANFVASRYTSDPSTTRVAGPLFDTPGYRMTARSVSRHKSIRLRADLYAYGNIGDDSVAQTISISLDGSAAGQINFEGPTGPTLSGGLTGSIERVGVNTTTNGLAYSKFALDVTLSHSAAAADFVFTPKYFRGVLNTSLGIDNIKMTLEVPPANTFDVALPLTVPSVQAAIEQGAGTLETPGAQDEYRFNLPAPAVLVFDAQNCLSGLSAVLTETTTGARTTLTTSCQDLITPVMPAGSYRLDVQASKTGSYTFDLFVKPDPQVFDLGVVGSSGLSVSDGVPSAGAGNPETRVSQDELRFSLGAAAQTLFLDFAGSAINPGWQLVRPDGTVLVSTSGNYRAEALPAGDYRLLLGTRTSIATAGKYTLRLTSAAPQTFDLGTLGSSVVSVSDGTPAAGAGRLETKASQDDYRFTLSAAQSVMLSGTCTGTGTTGGYLSWRLVKDDGSNTAISSSSYCPATVFNNLAAGNYRLVVKPQYEYTGTYRLDFMVVPDTQVFTLGTVTSSGLSVSDGVPSTGAGNLETRVSQDELRFTLDSAQTLFLDFAGSAINPGWQLVRSDGTVLVSTSGNYRAEALPAGDYRLVLGSRTSIATAGKYTLTLTSAAPQTFDLATLSTAITTVSDGTPAPGAGRLETKASQDDYRFTLSAAQSVMLNGTCTGTGTTGGYLSWRLVKDDGSNTAISSSSYCPATVFNNLAAGNYRLVVKPQYEYTGTYRLDFMVVPDTQVFTLGTVTSSGLSVSDGVPSAGAGNLETRVSQDELRFTLDSAQTLFLDFAGSAINPGWQLLKADGTVLVSTSGNYRAEALPAGDYRLLLGTRTSIATAGKYTLTLTSAAPQTFDLATLSTAITTVSDGTPAAGAGRLETKASQDDYRFTLSAAQSVMLNGTCTGTGTTGGYLSWRLVKDDGSNTTISSSSYCPATVFNNLAAGNYRLTIRPQYEYTGTYRLDFMVVPDTQIFTLGTVTSAGVTVTDGVPSAGAGNLETRVSQDELRFSLGAAAQTLFLDFAGSAINPGWQLVRPDGTVLVSTSGNYRAEALPAGDYRLLLGTRTSIATAGKYTLNLTTATNDTFDLGTLGSSVVSVSDGVPGVGAGKLETKASQDDYRFTLSAAQSVMLNGTCTGTGTTGGYLSWRLVKDDGSNTAISSSSYCPATVFNNLAAGNYRLVVKPQYEYTGTYRLDFMVVPDTQIFTLGTVTSAGVTVTDGVPSAGAGNLETRVSQDEYRLTLSSLTALSLDFAGSAINPGWQLVRPDGTVLVSTSGNYRAEALPAGDYRLLLGTRTSIATAGKYTLKLTTATSETFDLGTLGSSVVSVSDGVPGVGAGKLETKASQDDYRFTLSAAQSVMLSGTCTGTGTTGGYLSWRLVKDDGSNTAISSSSYCPATVFNNLAAGNYRLVVKPQYEYTGTYRLDFMVVPDTQVFTLGTVTSSGLSVSDGVPSAGAGNLETRVSQDELRFTLDSAQTLFLDFAGSAINPGWQLLKADGTVLVSTSGNYRAEALPAGDYRLLLGTRTSIATAGKYTLTLTSAAPQTFDLATLSTAITTVSDGTPAPGAGRLETKASQDDYRFTLSAAQSVMLNGACTGTGTTGGYLSWRLVKDDGSNTTISSSSYCPATVFNNLAAGNYRLVVKPQYEYTGTYRLDFMVVPDTQIFTLGTVTSAGVTVTDGVPSAGAGNLETRVSQDELRFSLGAAAQTLFLDFAGSAINPGWQLLKADGTVLVSTSGNYRAEALPAGDYRLLLGTRTSIATAGKYTLNLTTATNDTFDLGTLSTAITTVSDGTPAAGAGKLETKASQDDYRFTLSAAQSVMLNGTCTGTGTTGGYLSWRLVKDDGSNTTITSSSYCPATVFNNLAAGNYRFVVKPQYEYTGTYRLDFMAVPDTQVFALGSLPGTGLTVTDGVPSAGAGNLETRVSQDELRFSLGAAAQTLFLDFAGSAINPGWQLVRPDGTVLVSTSGNYRAEGLPAGDYRLLLGTRTSIATAGKYTLNLTTATNDTFDLGTLGSSVVSVSDGVPGVGAGKLETKASQDDYRFTLSAAQSVMLNGTCTGTGTTGGYLSWRLVKDDGSNTTITSSSYCPATVFNNLAAGNYRFVVKPQYEYTGTYRLDFMVVPDTQVFALGALPGTGLTVTDGVPSAGAGNLETRVSQDELRFSLGAAAQTLFLDFAGSAINPGWQLLKADGTALVSTSGNYRAEGLPAGDYRLLLGTRTSIATAGKYTLNLTTATNDTFDLGTLGSSVVSVSDGVPGVGAGKLETKASQDDYRFTLSAAQSVMLNGTCTGTGTTGGYLSWRLVKDDGSNTTITSSSYCPATVFNNLAAGNYRLTIRPQYEYTGTYRLDFKTN